ncbi:MAG: hypothetical protein Q4Q33_07790 [Eubacteriales bacterium]|nr:hypothetical protein [Eubacteriales bacterium]
MDKKILNILFLSSSIGFAISAFVFIFISMFSNEKPEWILPAGLFCVVLSYLFNIIRSILCKTK